MLGPKNVKAAADATAYDRGVNVEIILCEELNTLEADGRPIKKNAATENRGAVRIRTNGFSLNKA